MSSKYQWTQIGKQKIKLSNLDKIIYPDEQIIKAEVVQYYYRIAPTLLNHIKYRPLSLIRFPDGIKAASFFQKDRPEWAPDWIQFVRLGREDTKDYIYLTDEASVVWLANLACLELHIMQITKMDLEHPDYFVIDLDPGPSVSFKLIKELSLLLREDMLELGYMPFIKTSGGSGLHLFMPIEPKWSHDDVFEAVQDIANKMVKKQPKLCTLGLKKETRTDKILIDIYRNRPSQTIVAPYSLRGKPGGTVSMPISWNELNNIESNHDFNLRNVIEKVITSGDAWEGFSSYSTPIHTKQIIHTVIQRDIPGEKHKTPTQLAEYARKRDFKRTSEPLPSVPVGQGNAFVIHRHHASRIHYDLRLEKDGVLKSWALPKGLPPYPGVKRLAVQTEDHPLEYLHFDGEIPKDEYGAGKMWNYATGKYTITKEKKDGFYFKLASPSWDAEYRMHNLKDKDWLLERVDTPIIIYDQYPWDVMLAEQQTSIPIGNDFVFEIKWDGIRSIIVINDNQITIHSRNKNNLNKQFPEILAARDFIKASNAVLDAEIVCLDEKGRPIFKRVISRLHHQHDSKIERAVKTNPAFAYIFDILYLDGKPLINEPLLRRKEWLQDIIKAGSPFRYSQHIEDGPALLEAAKSHQLEGIIIKNRLGKYYPGKRSTDWIKIKFRQSITCYIVGYTKGQGERENLFGAIHIMELNKKEKIYRGKVGTGFDSEYMEYLKEKMDSAGSGPKLFNLAPVEDKVTSWINPVLTCEVEFASMTDHGTLREPVFKGLIEEA